MYISINMIQRHHLTRRGNSLAAGIIKKTWKSSKELWTLTSITSGTPIISFVWFAQRTTPSREQVIARFSQVIASVPEMFFQDKKLICLRNKYFASSLYTMAVIRHSLFFLDSYKDRYSVIDDPQRTRILKLSVSSLHVIRWVKEYLFDVIVLVSVAFLNVLSISHLIYPLKPHRLWSLYIYTNMLKFLIIVNMCLQPYVFIKRFLSRDASK